MTHSDSQVNEVKSPQVVKSPKVEKEVVPEQKEIVPSPRMSTWDNSELSENGGKNVLSQKYAHFSGRMRCLKSCLSKGFHCILDSVGMLRLPSRWKYWKIWSPPGKVRELTKNSPNQTQRMRRTKRENMACLGDQPIWWGYDPGNATIEVPLVATPWIHISLQLHFYFCWRLERHKVKEMFLSLLTFLEDRKVVGSHWTTPAMKFRQPDKTLWFATQEKKKARKWWTIWKMTIELKSVFFLGGFLRVWAARCKRLLSYRPEHSESYLFPKTSASNPFKIHFPQNSRPLKIQWFLGRIHRFEGMVHGAS